MVETKMRQNDNTPYKINNLKRQQLSSIYTSNKVYITCIPQFF